MPAPDTIRAADAIARRLYAAGCRHAFSMPGGEVLTLVDALEAAGIEFILCKHENAAGFMAEAAWHQTGAPGIMVATIGPGVLNGVNAIANALQDRVPLIVLSGCVDAAKAETYTHQVLDQQAVLRPIVKGSFRLSAGAAHVIADKAVGIAMEGRPGPVHIDVPISVADTRVAATAPAPRCPAAVTAPSGQALETARNWLAGAQRPVMIVGVDAMNEGASEAVTEFAQRFGIPVITTYKAKGLIPETHSLALGAAGLSPLADSHLVPFVQQADLVLCVGYDPIEMRPGWRDIWDPRVVLLAGDMGAAGQGRRDKRDPLFQRSQSAVSRLAPRDEPYRQRRVSGDHVRDAADPQDCGRRYHRLHTARGTGIWRRRTVFGQFHCRGGPLHRLCAHHDDPADQSSLPRPELQLRSLGAAIARGAAS